MTTLLKLLAITILTVVVVVVAAAFVVVAAAAAVVVAAAAVIILTHVNFDALFTVSSIASSKFLRKSTSAAVLA